MMLQNRVDPYGNIFKTRSRGTLMGNRGVIHDHHKNIIRTFKLKAWITCKLEFKGWHRAVMTPNRYTELFFLDEATAFAAGHRPCSECRRQDYNRFKSCWLAGNGEYGFDAKIAISRIDEIIHQERINSNGTKVLYEESTDQIPDGTFVVYRDSPYLFSSNLLYKWSPAGYELATANPNLTKILVLTPRSVVNSFRAGYVPEVGLK